MNKIKDQQPPHNAVLAEAISKRWHLISESERLIVDAIVSYGRAEIGNLNDPVPSKYTETISSGEETKRLRADFLFWLLNHEIVVELMNEKRVILRGLYFDGPYLPEHNELAFELHFSNCLFEHCFLDGLQAISLSFIECQFQKGLSCVGISLQTDLFFSDCALPYLDVERASIRGDLSVINADAVRLMGAGASIGGLMRLTTRPQSIGPVIAHLDSASIGGVTCSGPGFQFLSFKQAKVATDLSIDVAFVEGDEGMNGSSLEQLSVHGTLSWLAQPSRYTRLYLAHAKVRIFRDTVSSLIQYPLLDIAGFTYEEIELVEKGDGWIGPQRGRATLPHRWMWLANQPPWHFSFQPYKQFADFLERQGQYTDASQTLIRGVEEHRRRACRGLASKLWTVVLRLTVGHGYRPQRSLLWIAMFIICGAAVFSIAKTEGLLVLERPPEVTRFNAIAYSIDTFLPIVDLRQEKYWIASGVGPTGLLVQIYSWVHAAFGWALSTLAVAAFSGILKKRT